MARLPDYTNLGGGAQSFATGRARPQAPGVNLDTNASALARGAKSIGASLNAIGEDYKREEDEVNTLKADAEWKAQRHEMKRTFEDDPDYQTYDQRFTPRAKEIAAKTASLIKDPKIRERFLLRAESDVTTDRDWLLSKGKGLARQSMIVESEKALDRYQDIYLRAKTPEEQDQASADLEAGIELLKKNGLATPEVEAKLREKYLEGTKRKSIEMRIDMGDESVLKDLDEAMAERPELPTVSLNIRDLPQSGIRASARKGQVKGVIIHHTSGSSVDGAISHGAKMGTGTTYYVDRDGTVIRAAPENMRTIHMRDKSSRYRTDKGQIDLDNDSAIGIEVVARNNGDVLPIQKAALKALVADIAARNKLDIKAAVFGHGELQGGKGGNRESDEGIFARELRGETPVQAGSAKTDGPIPLAERGFTKVAGLKGEMNTATDAAPTPVARKPRYSGLPVDVLADYRRRAETKKGEILAGRRSELKQQLDDDIESIRATGQPRQNAPELDVARKVLEPNQVATYEIKRKAAKMEWEATHDLDMLDNEALKERVFGLVPKAGSDDYALQSDVYRAAEAKKKAIIELRDRDPALSVNESPEVKAAVKAMDPENPDRSVLVRSRIEAQDRLGISRYDQRIITRDEAKALLDMGSADDMTEKEKLEALRAAGERAKTMYGPYASQAMNDAAKFYVRDAFGKDAAATIIKKLAMNEPIKARDYRQADEMDKIDSAERAFTAAPKPAARPPKSEAGPRREPSPAARQALVDNITKNPALAREFDRKYYAGAAAEVLFGGAR